MKNRGCLLAGMCACDCVVFCVSGAALRVGKDVSAFGGVVFLLVLCGCQRGFTTAPQCLRTNAQATTTISV
eukprot:1178967-Rhodomonas_salina.1